MKKETRLDRGQPFFPAIECFYPAEAATAAAGAAGAATAAAGCCFDSLVHP